MLPINTYEKFAELATLVLKVIDNLLKNPDEEKYRQLKLKNAKIKAAIVDAVGGVDLMKAIGFKTHVDDFGVHSLRLSAPDKDGNARKNKLEEVRDWLQGQLDAVKESGKRGPMSDCILQIKMSNALTYNAAFGCKETMQEVLEHVQQCSRIPKERRGDMVLCSNYPYVEYGDDLLAQTVEEAGLMPRAQLFLKREMQQNTTAAFSEDAIKKAARLKEDRLKREKKVADKKKTREDTKKQREMAIFAFQEDRADAAEKQQWKKRAEEARLAKEQAELQKAIGASNDSTEAEQPEEQAAEE